MRTRKMLRGSSSSGTKFNEVDSAQAVDFLSSIPDNVLVHFFSFLTMKEALYTCISCKKLMRLSRLIPNIEFDDTAHRCFSGKRKFVQVVSRFLGNHEGRIKKFRLSFSPKRYESEVLGWLDLVVKHGIEDLDLRFDRQNTLGIDTSYLADKTLKVLRLRNCTVDIKSLTSFKFLTSLLLGHTYISDSLMVLLLCGFESLLELHLETCWGFEQIEIVDPKSKLETLILNGSCVNLSRLNISSLKMLGIAKRDMNFSFISHPHIEKLVLLRGQTRITQQESEHMKANIIDRLMNVEHLYLASWAFKCFAAFRSVENYQFTNLKVLNFDVHVCLNNLTELNKLVRQATSVQVLLMSMIEDSSKDNGIYGDCNFERVIAHFLHNEGNADRSSVRLSNYALEVIEIRGFRGTILEVSHVKYMLAHYPNLTVLKTNVTEGVDKDQISAYEMLFQSFQRASADVEIIVERNENDGS